MFIFPGCKVPASVIPEVTDSDSVELDSRLDGMAGCMCNQLAGH